MIHVTEKAVRRIREVMEKEHITGGLRVVVQGGGCSGLSYVVRYEQSPRAQDQIYENDGVRIFVDPKSLQFLDGMTLDWKQDLMQQGFVFDNPNAKKSCGCGTSFTPA
jgi:iron-sulfur cluster assembly protein